MAGSTDTTVRIERTSRSGRRWPTAGAAAALVAGVIAAAGPASATFPGENGMIAFQAGDIWVMEPDGSSPVNLTDNPYTQRGPAWSPDGASLAYASAEDNPNNARYEIYVMNADGSDQTRLTFTDDISEFQPAWSPDGERIAFIRGPNSAVADLWVMDADGGNEEMIVPGAVQPAWSPDGERLAFVDGGGTLGFLHQGAIVTTNAECLSPSWSPDSLRIVCATSTNVPRVASITHYDITGGDPVEVIHWPDAGVAFDPEWSPDGQYLLFGFSALAGGLFTAADFYRTDPAGMAVVNLTEGIEFGVNAPSWQPVVETSPPPPPPPDEPGAAPPGVSCETDGESSQIIVTMPGGGDRVRARVPVVLPFCSGG